MIEPAEHPIVLIAVLLLAYPVYRGLAYVVFGSSDDIVAAVKYLKAPDSWNPFKSDWSEDWNMSCKLFAYAALCIAFITAVYDLCVRYMISA
jgi:hypothetical protein